MTFQQIRYLLEIHRTGSVAAAAKALYLVPSSLSIAISNLEQELGYKIFDRTRNGMVPTPEGLEVIHHANRIYSSYLQMLKPKKGSSTEFRIRGTDFAPTNTAFVRLATEYKDRSDLSLSKAFSSYRLLHQKLLAGEAELLVLLHNESSVPTVQASAEAKGLAVKVLKMFPLSAAIGPAHSLYDAQTLSYKHLEDQLLADHPSTFNNHRKQLKALLPSWQERKILSNNHPTLDQLVNAGIAFSIGPEFQTAETKARGLRYIRMGNQHQVLIAVYNPTTPMLPEVQRYLELLQEELDKKKEL